MYINESKVFNYIYKYNLWGFGSGTGSISFNNKKYINFLNIFINNKNINKIIDLGCGDWQLHKHIDFKKKNYIGIDIVKNIIDINNKLYSNKNIKFQHKNFLDLDFNLPNGDLLILKDVLQHLSNININIILNKIEEKNYKYILIINDISKINFNYINIANGMYKTIDISRSPYNYKINLMLEYYENIYLIFYICIILVISYLTFINLSKKNSLTLLILLFFGYFILPKKKIYLLSKN